MPEVVAKPLISIIVPVYKVERYLRRCVNSILAQTYSNFELVLIDDGSPDGCPAICDEYAKKDSRVRVIHQTNQGLAEVRNVGVLQSRGEYIAFIDSDDFVASNYIETLYRGIKEFGADISICSFRKVQSEMTETEEKEFSEFKEVSFVKAMKYFASFQPGVSIAFVSACSKLYKKELFDGVKYPKGKLYEDSYTSYKLLYRATKMFFSTSRLYYYYENPQSITAVKFSERTLDILDASRSAVSFFAKENRFDVVNILNEFLLAREIYCWWGVKYVLKKKKRAKELLKTYRTDFRRACGLKEFSIKWKIIFCVFALCPDIYALYKKISPVYIGNR